MKTCKSLVKFGTSLLLTCTFFLSVNEGAMAQESNTAWNSKTFTVANGGTITVITTASAYRDIYNSVTYIYWSNHSIEIIRDDHQSAPLSGNGVFRYDLDQPPTVWWPFTIPSIGNDGAWSFSYTLGTTNVDVSPMSYIIASTSFTLQGNLGWVDDDRSGGVTVSLGF